MLLSAHVKDVCWLERFFVVRTWLNIVSLFSLSVTRTLWGRTLGWRTGRQARVRNAQSWTIWSQNCRTLAARPEKQHTHTQYNSKICPCKPCYTMLCVNLNLIFISFVNFNLVLFTASVWPYHLGLSKFVCLCQFFTLFSTFLFCLFSVHLAFVTTRDLLN